MSFVIPVYKKGNKHNALNYRPISLTSGFSRNFEHIISIKILSHLFDYNLLYDKQFGFVPNRSSNIQLLTWIKLILLIFKSGVSLYIKRFNQT